MTPKPTEIAAQQAVEVVNAAASRAADVVAVAAAEAVKTLNTKNTDCHNDHDLIIKLDTKLDALKEDIKNLSDGTAAKIQDHEERIRKMEEKVTKILTWGSVGLLALGVIQFLIGKFV